MKSTFLGLFLGLTIAAGACSGDDDSTPAPMAGRGGSGGAAGGGSGGLGGASGGGGGSMAGAGGASGGASGAGGMVQGGAGGMAQGGAGGMAAADAAAAMDGPSEPGDAADGGAGDMGGCPAQQPSGACVQADPGQLESCFYGATHCTCDEDEWVCNTCPATRPQGDDGDSAGNRCMNAGDICIFETVVCRCQPPTWSCAD